MTTNNTLEMSEYNRLSETTVTRWLILPMLPYMYQCFDCDILLCYYV